VHNRVSITVTVDPLLIELDTPNPGIPTVLVALPDVLTVMNVVTVAVDSNVVNPDCNDDADMSAFVVSVVALPEIDDCEVLSKLLDNVALPLVTDTDGRSTFTDTVAWPEVETLEPNARLDSSVANADVDVVAGLVKVEVNVALVDNDDKAF